MLQCDLTAVACHTLLRPDLSQVTCNTLLLLRSELSDAVMLGSSQSPETCMVDAWTSWTPAGWLLEYYEGLPVAMALGKRKTVVGKLSTFPLKIHHPTIH